MCYEFESWHWKARAKEMHKARPEPSVVEKKKEADSPAPRTPHESSKAGPKEKVPA